MGKRPFLILIALLFGLTLAPIAAAAEATFRSFVEMKADKIKCFGDGDAKCAQGSIESDRNCSSNADCDVGCRKNEPMSKCLSRAEIDPRPLRTNNGGSAQKDGMNVCLDTGFTDGGVFCGCLPKSRRCGRMTKAYFEAASTTAPPQPKHQPNPQTCATEGQSAGGSCVGCLSCCEGLVATNSFQFSEFVRTGRCDSATAPGSAGSCIKCGDGKCDAKNFETPCNCPKDCPSPAKGETT